MNASRYKRVRAMLIRSEVWIQYYITYILRISITQSTQTMC